jgi:hypothetical protein
MILAVSPPVSGHRKRLIPFVPSTESLGEFAAGAGAAWADPPPKCEAAQRHGGSTRNSLGLWGQGAKLQQRRCSPASHDDVVEQGDGDDLARL